MPAKFCLNCAAPMRRAIPEMDDHQRDICDVCGYIYYENPKVIVGTIPVWENKVLLCKRNIVPRKGLWTLPAGYMEMDETVEEGAIRETHEEAGADIKLGRLFYHYSIPNIGQVYMIFLAKINTLGFDFGFETQEVKLYTEEEIPWDEIAFKSIEFGLRKYFEYLKTGYQGVYIGSKHPDE